MTQDLLFEIGTEEIPARFMDSAMKQLKDLAKIALTEARLDYMSLATYGTPRRLCLYVSKLAQGQEDRVREVKGPAKKAAYDAEGNPTKAAQGFARGQKVAVEDLVAKTAGNGEYVFATVRDVGKSAQEILPEILLGLINGLNFPKPMRWGDKDFRFARPIHWLVALFGTEIIHITLEGIESDRYTYGHRFLSTGKLNIKDPKSYFEILEKAAVIVEQEKRSNMIREQLAVLGEQENGKVDLDEELLAEVTQLLEYPTAFVGSFSPEYLKLPEEVVITAMKEHQRYFPIRDDEGKLLPRFLAVRNGDAQHLDVVQKGNEKVLEARLADAHFFYQEDLKVPLEQKVEGLKNIIFQEKLGTLWEKNLRVQKLAVMVAQQLGWPAEITAIVQRTAYLAKGDLVTNMVNEFPELQGIMGAYYAEPAEGQAVAEGIREHYLPRFSGDIVPHTQAGIAVGIADKVDTIVGCFLAGLIPTGSQDPYALRRQALGICHTILEHQLPISLKELAQASLNLYVEKFPDKEQREIIEVVSSFYKQRLENILNDKGLPYDVIEAVLEVGWEHPFDVLERAQVLYRFAGRETFLSLITAFTRAFNLTKNGVTKEINSIHFQEPIEEELYQNLQTANRVIKKHLEVGDYRSALDVIVTLKEPVDQFFEEVMVMVEDNDIKENRLALLQNVVDLARKVADFSKLVMKGT